MSDRAWPRPLRSFSTSLPVLRPDRQACAARPLDSMSLECQQESTSTGRADPLHSKHDRLCALFMPILFFSLLAGEFGPIAVRGAPWRRMETCVSAFKKPSFRHTLAKWQGGQRSRGLSAWARSVCASYR